MIAHDVKTFTNSLNNYLSKVNNWATQLKASFIPNPNKKAQEIGFSRK